MSIKTKTISKLNLEECMFELELCEKHLLYAYSNNTQNKYLPRVKMLKKRIAKLTK